MMVWQISIAAMAIVFCLAVVKAFNLFGYDVHSQPVCRDCADELFTDVRAETQRCACCNKPLDSVKIFSDAESKTRVG